MDEDATWYEGKPKPRRHCVRWGHSPPAPAKGGWHSRLFSVSVCGGQTVALSAAAEHFFSILNDSVSKAICATIANFVAIGHIVTHIVTTIF